MEPIDVLLSLLTIAGAAAASLFAAWLTRKSQAESNKINEANSIITRYESLVGDVQEERTTTAETNNFLRRQITLWKRWAHQLKDQIYQLGGKPKEPPEDLEL